MNSGSRSQIKVERSRPDVFLNANTASREDDRCLVTIPLQTHTQIHRLLFPLRAFAALSACLRDQTALSPLCQVSSALP